MVLANTSSVKIEELNDNKFKEPKGSRDLLVIKDN